MWVVVGVAMAIFGILPRLTSVSWGVLVTCLLLGQLGQILQFPQWSLNLSPFSHIPRLPSADVNRVMTQMTEHGLTPSSIVARMTYLGAPESLQGAVAAGLNGLGTVFVGSIEGAAKMLSETMPVPDAHADFSSLASIAVDTFRSQKKIVPGIGHPFHKPIDPRTPRLLQIARETGFDGPYVKLMLAIAEDAAAKSGKVLPVNATGAIGALCCEMKFDWKICRGLGVMGRAVGLVGHILEESRNPMSEEVWRSVEARATAHMNPDLVGE